MVYVPYYVAPAFKESGMDAPGSSTNRVAALNMLEQQAAEGLNYIDNFLHDDLAIHSPYTAGSICEYHTKTLADATFFRRASHPLGRNDGPGSLLNAATIDGYTLNDLQALAIPSGAIALWAKSVKSISASWLFMNGQNGTIDTRGRILICSGNGYSPGTLGGATSVTPYANAFDLDPVVLTTNQIPQHQHGFNDTYNREDSYGEDKGSYTKNNKWLGQNTYAINGIANHDPTAHPHTNNTFTWTGYYDENNVYHTGSLPLLVKSKAYAWILKR